MFSKVLLIGALCIIGAYSQEALKDCLQKDSISCVQMAVRSKLQTFIFTIGLENYIERTMCEFK